jgi:hypothetical protein
VTNQSKGDGLSSHTSRPTDYPPPPTQGIAGGGLAPSEQAMLVDTFPPAKRAAKQRQVFHAG